MTHFLIIVLGIFVITLLFLILDVMYPGINIILSLFQLLQETNMTVGFY